MIAGFDYGTSNCALSTAQKGVITRIPLEANSHYLPSLVYAEARDAITEFVASHINSPQLQQTFAQDRAVPLRNAANFRAEYGISPAEPLVHFGAAAMAQYTLAPAEGFFAKSPKSFLGASGLAQSHLTFFEDVVTAMMMQVNHKTQLHTGHNVSHIVIGRPVNFSSLNTDAGNRQAINILTAAAKRSGYQYIEFLYEPLAAGLAFEQTLTSNQLVLVLDIGGGTSDCTLMHMGPSFKDKTDRSADFLAHCGIRTGGNDLDIQLAAKAIMPLMGMGSSTKDGLPIPSTYYWNAVRINDVNAQSQFYSPQNVRNIQALATQAQAPQLVSRLIHMLNHKKNFAVIKSSEQAKIELSSLQEYSVPLNYIEPDLTAVITRELLRTAIAQPLAQIEQLVKDTVKAAGAKPHLVFITGGSGQSPIIREAMHNYFGDIPLVDGDHFGSVVTGLAQWAAKVFE